MASESDPEVTAFVRHELIGDDPARTGDLAEKFRVSKPTITNIRKGRQGVGGVVLIKIAKAFFGGSVDELRAKAAQFAKAHPELVVVTGAEQETFARGEIHRLLVDDGAADREARELVERASFYHFEREPAVAALRTYRMLREKLKTGKVTGERPGDDFERRPGPEARGRPRASVSSLPSRRTGLVTDGSVPPEDKPGLQPPARKNRAKLAAKPGQLSRANRNK
jgi:hypothetical protein